MDGRQWQWYTLWNPLELEAFDDVWIIGNCFTQAITNPQSLITNESTIQDHQIANHDYQPR